MRNATGSDYGAELVSSYRRWGPGSAQASGGGSQAAAVETIYPQNRMNGPGLDAGGYVTAMDGRTT